MRTISWPRFSATHMFPSGPWVTPTGVLEVPSVNCVRLTAPALAGNANASSAIATAMSRRMSGLRAALQRVAVVDRDRAALGRHPPEGAHLLQRSAHGLARCARPAREVLLRQREIDARLVAAALGLAEALGQLAQASRETADDVLPR